MGKAEEVIQRLVELQSECLSRLAHLNELIAQLSLSEVTEDLSKEALLLRIASDPFLHPPDRDLVKEENLALRERVELLLGEAEKHAASHHCMAKVNAPIPALHHTNPLARQTSSSTRKRRGTEDPDPCHLVSRINTMPLSSPSVPSSPTPSRNRAESDDFLATRLASGVHEEVSKHLLRLDEMVQHQNTVSLKLESALHNLPRKK